tara:strand:- start:420 stop:524 length:105 start_codon:yes stop_codon:yes gene_type:complete
MKNKAVFLDRDARRKGILLENDQTLLEIVQNQLN